MKDIHRAYYRSFHWTRIREVISRQNSSPTLNINFYTMPSHTAANPGGRRFSSLDCCNEDTYYDLLSQFLLFYRS